jgi:hypothetical protein
MLREAAQGPEAVAKKKKTVAAPPPGNQFEYFIPKRVRTAAGTLERVKPAVTPAAGSTPPKYPQPAKFIKDHFEATTSAPFGKNGTLPSSQVIQDIQVVRAALECGYGPRSKWTSALAMQPHEATGLASYLILRLQTITSCIESDASGAKVPRSFYTRVESSEKLALSFIVGGIGTYLAARQWLEAGGQKVSAFLHAGIYSKAINGAAPPVPFAPGSGKMPDYLVASTSGDWHVFESKGGLAGSRWARIVEGLAQLQGLPKLGWAGTPAVQAQTCVCVHTSVDCGRKLHVTAVDPPGDGTPEGPAPTDAPSDGPPKLLLIEGVCKLLLLLETLEQFRALADDLIPLPDAQAPAWKMATSSHFGGLLVGVPKRYIRREDEVRRRLAVFLAITEVLSDPALNKSKDAARSFASMVSKKFEASALGERALRLHPDRVKKLLASMPSDFGSENFLLAWSEKLKLGRLASKLMPNAPEKVFFALARNMPNVLTSGGMYLEQLEQNPPRALVAVETVLPRS